MKKLKKLITLTALLVLCLSLTACGGKKLNLSDYLSISFNGVDGMGTAYLQFDASQMELDYAGVKDGFPTQKQFEKMTKLAPFEFSVNYELDKSENLKNGDKVTATITYGKERAKEAKVKVGSVKRTFTVEGLQEPILIDPFDESVFGEGKKVEIMFNGTDPFIYADIINHAYMNDIFYKIKYTFADENYDFKTGIQNGDELTIHAGLDYLSVNKGYVLTRDEITITVSGMEAYVKQAEDLPSDYLQELKERVLKEAEKDGYTHLFTEDSSEIFGIYGGMDLNDARSENIRLGDTALLFGNDDYYTTILFPVYRDIIVDNWKEQDDPEPYQKTFRNVFAYYGFVNLLIHGDGTISNEANNKIGSFVNQDVANKFYLNDLKNNYKVIEIKLP